MASGGRWLELETGQFVGALCVFRPLLSVPSGPGGRCRTLPRATPGAGVNAAIYLTFGGSRSAFIWLAQNNPRTVTITLPVTITLAVTIGAHDGHDHTFFTISTFSLRFDEPGALEPRKVPETQRVREIATSSY